MDKWPKTPSIPKPPEKIFPQTEKAISPDGREEPEPKSIDELLQRNLEIHDLDTLKKEDAKLETFVNRIEIISPDKRIDIFNPDFWVIYGKFLQEIWENEYLPLVGGQEKEQILEKNSPNDLEMRRQKLLAMGYSFSGHSIAFSSTEQIMRVKIRGFLSALEQEGVSGEARNLVQAALPTYFKSEYRTDRVDESVSKQLYEEKKKLVGTLQQHSEYQKISDVMDKFSRIEYLSRSLPRALSVWMSKINHSLVPQYDAFDDKRYTGVINETDAKAARDFIEAIWPEFKAALLSSSTPTTYSEDHKATIRTEEEKIKNGIASQILTNVSPFPRITRDANVSTRIEKQLITNERFKDPTTWYWTI